MDSTLIWTEQALARSNLIDNAIIRRRRKALMSLHGRECLVGRAELLKEFPDIGPRYPRISGIHCKLLSHGLPDILSHRQQSEGDIHRANLARSPKSGESGYINPPVLAST